MVSIYDCASGSVLGSTIAFWFLRYVIFADSVAPENVQTGKLQWEKWQKKWTAVFALWLWLSHGYSAPELSFYWLFRYFLEDPPAGLVRFWFFLSQFCLRICRMAERPNSGRGVGISVGISLSRWPVGDPCISYRFWHFWPLLATFYHLFTWGNYLQLFITFCFVDFSTFYQLGAIIDQFCQFLALFATFYRFWYFWPLLTTFYHLFTCGNFLQL